MKTDLQKKLHIIMDHMPRISAKMSIIQYHSQRRTSVEGITADLDVMLCDWSQTLLVLHKDSKREKSEENRISSATRAAAAIE